MKVDSLVLLLLLILTTLLLLILTTLLLLITSVLLVATLVLVVSLLTTSVVPLLLIVPLLLLLRTTRVFILLLVVALLLLVRRRSALLLVLLPRRVVLTRRLLWRWAVKRVGMIWGMLLLWRILLLLTVVWALSLWSWLCGTPRAGSGLVHLIASPIPCCEIALVLIDIHTSIALLKALSIAGTEIRNRSSSSVQSRTSDNLITRFERWWWRSCSREHGALVRKLRWLGESDTQHFAALDILGKEVVMADTPDFLSTNRTLDSAVLFNLLGLVAKLKPDKASESLDSNTSAARLLCIFNIHTVP